MSKVKNTLRQLVKCSTVNECVPACAYVQLTDRSQHVMQVSVAKPWWATVQNKTNCTSLTEFSLFIFKLKRKNKLHSDSSNDGLFKK